MHMTLANGFKIGGIYPFYRHAFSEADFHAAEQEEQLQNGNVQELNQSDVISTNEAESSVYEDDVKSCDVAEPEIEQSTVPEIPGTNQPIISKFLEPSGSANVLLGANIMRPGASNWELIITISQDYETNPTRYVFEIKVNDASEKVFLYIGNLDDEKPFIETTVANNPCKIQENKLGSTQCYYKISDLDGIINDTVKYTLSSTGSNINEIFEIINVAVLQNGMKEWKTELVVLKELDFEELPSYIFDFSVTDSGNNEYSVKIVIEVIDLPDKPPVWRQIFSSAKFPEKQKKTYVVRATDGDVNIDAPIRYSITSDWPNLFKINEETGEITIEKIDRDSLGIELFSFELLAYEKDDPNSNTSQSITIVVEDINDHEPKITIDKTQVLIPESTVATLDVKIEISDVDLGNNAKYKVLLVKNDYSNSFQIVPNNGYQNSTFSISVVNSQSLDYEDPKWKNIELTIRSEEEYDKTHNDEKSITINLDNWNDETPKFSEEEYIKAVPEDISKDSEIIIVLAEDRDFGDSVKYSLLGEEINKMFTIDDNGLIKTKINNTLDYEKQTLVFIQILAVDTLGEPFHKTIAQLTIEVQDVNDERPSITVASESISIEENRPNGTIINQGIDITAFDVDTASALEFAIDWFSSSAVKNGQLVKVDEWIFPETHFDPTTKTAKVFLKVVEVIPENTPDFEQFDTMYLSLVVTDTNQTIGINKNRVRVTITIEDLNDNAPIFVDDTINSKKTVVEGAEANTRIGTVTATDMDGINHNKIVYSLRPLNNETPTGWVDIHPDNGELFVPEDAVIDADLPIYQLDYIVKATNADLCNETNITVKVIDTNSKPPECIFAKTVHIFEKTPNGTKVPQEIVCTDKDRDASYNTPWFRFSSSAIEVKNLFFIDTFTGQIYVNIKGDNELNRDEGTAKYTIPFIVSDNYNQEGSTQQNTIEYDFTLILDDINDNFPIIQSTTVPGNEVMKIESTLGEILAKDIDEPNTNNAKINFEVLDVTKGSDGGADPPKDMFRVEVENDYSGIGNLITNYNLRGYYGTYIALIKAFDFGNFPKPQSSTKEIKVVIEKYNFLPPIFIYPSPENSKAFYLAKTQEIGKQLYQSDGTLLDPFRASDQQNEKWDIKITVDDTTNPNGLFALLKSGKSEAMLVLTSLPSLSGTYVVKLIADCNCKGDEPYSTSLTINIRFIDINSEPEFEKNDETLEFPENTTGITKALPKAYFNKEGEDWDFIPYYFITEDSSGAFEIENSTTAQLKLVKVIDREEISSLTLKVVTSKNPNGNASPEKNSILNVLINIKDINDNEPIFDKPEFYSGVKPSDSLNSLMLVITATDLDIDDALEFHILPETLQAHGDGLNAFQYPFYIKTDNDKLDHIIGKGNVYLNFTVQPYMNGYFTFNVKVVRLAFEENIGYRCNIESIETSADDTGTPISDQTDVITHFVNTETNEAVNSVDIQQIFANYKVFSKLSTTLVEEGLYLLSLNNNPEVGNNEEVLRAWLIGVSAVLGTFCLALIIAFIIKTRSLLSRLNKLSVPKFGSQESGLNRVGLAAPNTNKHAEGSNPVYGNEKKTPEIDRLSIGSGDSELIGVEDDPNFDINRRVS
ncbi:hypothetical protein RN001_005161 [Aquatica leii]|uniref:Cadherin domain-containing protein n=1 Tax=Aquatica leii TaxID=1421715 RepID=A0AAN7Q0T2_9COLE|nr:hypothetical protein RN001_005161 [Aquatica leii]